ncbi:hypothetical protein Pan216_22480 [Planctomycetes bacterium Pan216]|uniref:Uncharacterized protein n=1 Tax=Kolteria novifilia TaxID=2527975 RepID=A0A518B373_9BACT|nr:hypothetical protein Pan216_22480 [Planctomycetes bacterium Pan216]
MPKTTNIVSLLVAACVCLMIVGCGSPEPPIEKQIEKLEVKKVEPTET